MITFGSRIKTRRISLGMSQDTLAKLTGYQSRSSINKIELNKRNLKQKQITDFARALHTTEAYLMGWVDDPELTQEDVLNQENNNLHMDTDTPIIIGADAINTNNVPTVLNCYDNPLKTEIIQLLSSTDDIPEHILLSIKTLLEPYKK